MNDRTASIRRKTRETEIELVLNLDGSRQIEISTGLGFFDHMLTALAFHARWDLSLKCSGDLQVDDHHTIEDCGLALGQAIGQSLAGKAGIRRFASNYAPLDEALARCVIDFSGRGGGYVDLNLKREKIGDVACENLEHFFQSVALSGQFTIHVDVLKGENDHHKAEAGFKAAALTFADATAVAALDDVPSTKGTLS